MDPVQSQPPDPLNDSRNINDNSSQSEAYYVALRNWLQAAQSWSNLAAAYQVLLRSEICVLRAHNYGYSPSPGNPGLRSRGVRLPSNAPPFVPFENTIPGQPVPGQPMPGIPPMAQGSPPTFAPPQPHVHLHRRSRFRIAPIWKRFVAEFLDFLFLFFLKLIATFIAIDFFDFINLDKLDLDVFTKALDYKSLMELTAEIVVLELIHRVVVCLYETFWLQRGGVGKVGGATPGKALMGLCVIRCDEAICVPGRPESVFIKPGNHLGLTRSFIRAFLKNFLLSILFPVCAFLVFFKHNQTAYDVVSKSIVIEVVPTVGARPRQQ